MTCWYFRFYIPQMAAAARAEVSEQTRRAAGRRGGIRALVATGHGWELLVIYLIPQRLGIGCSPGGSTGCPITTSGDGAAADRFRATRVRVGVGVAV